jgi:hypothetical protein
MGLQAYERRPGRAVRWGTRHPRVSAFVRSGHSPAPAGATLGGVPAAVSRTDARLTAHRVRSSQLRTAPQ